MFTGRAKPIRITSVWKSDLLLYSPLISSFCACCPLIRESPLYLDAGHRLPVPMLYHPSVRALETWNFKARKQTTIECFVGNDKVYGRERSRRYASGFVICLVAWNVWQVFRPNRRPSCEQLLCYWYGGLSVGLDTWCFQTKEWNWILSCCSSCPF